MRNILKTLCLICILQSLNSSKIYAATIDWKGTTSIDWGTATNWSPATVPAPGDAVQIGVVAFTNQPTLNSGTITTIGSLTFGVTKNITLTVNSGSTLAVTGSITQNPSNAFLTGSGTLTTTLAGAGSITCASVNVGNNSVFLSLFTTNNLNLVSTISNFHITGNVAVNSTTFGVLFLGFAYNNATFSVQGGTTVIDGTILTANTNSGLFPTTFATPTFSVDMPSGSSLSPVLQLTNAAAINTASVAGTIDFYNNTGGTGTSTVYYNGATNQEVYTNTTAALNTSPDVYQNLIFSGSLTKKADGGNLTVGNNLTLAAASTETVDFATNNPTVTVGGNLTTNSGTTLKQGSGSITVGVDVANGGTLTLGSGALNVAGNYTNTGTFTASTGMVTFNGSTAETLNDSGNGTQFNFVTFNSGGSKTINSGNFSVSSTGVLTMGSSTSLAAGGYLTLNSDASGSATVAAIPAGASITGNVNVQRYITGGAGHRSYRLLSSQVTQGSGDYSINYLINSTFLTGTGGTGGGFDKAGNPTLYLFRENLAPLYTTYINSNFRGINTISSSPNYLIDGDAGTFNIPIGNGYLFFFRGSRATVNPYITTTIPIATTLTATGTLNAGAITVIDWYTPGSSNLGYTTTSANSTVRGFNLMGNPYASSINWDTFSTTVSTAGLYGPSLTQFMYALNPVSENYGVYQVGTGGVGTNNVTNIIASGQGFFVKATSTSAQLTFNETAKVNTQVTGPSLLMDSQPLAQASNQMLRLRMLKDSVNTDEIFIRFNSTAKAAYDQNEDAIYLTGQGQVSLASLSADNISLAINQLPLPKQQAQVVGLKINAKADGIYSLNMVDIKEIPELYDIWLMDAYKKDSLDMRHNSTYNFNVFVNDTTTCGSKRFKLIIRQNQAYAYRLLDFTAIKLTTGSGVQAIWNTENEQNYTNFTVERSTDGGKTFEVIGGLTGSGLGTYSLVDRNPLNGENLYRLKQEDLNSVITYTQPVVVMYAASSGTLANNLISVYPNPARSTINLTIVGQPTATAAYSIVVTNSLGIPVKQATVAQPEWQSSIGNLVPGDYVIRVVNNKDKNLVGQIKFVKL